MAYQSNKPMATDQLSVSQIDIQGNFAAIKTLIDVNLVDFASSDQGKHNLSQYVNQSVDPTLGATEIAAYNKVSGVTSVQELFIKKGVGAPFSITSAQGGGTGWSSLSSGFILQWGEGTVTGSGTLNFALTFPSTCYQVVACIQDPNAGDINKAVRVVSWTTAGATFYVSPRTTTGSATSLISFFAIGV